MRLSLLILSICLSAQAANYYVDYAGGSDAANGTTTGTPWKHLRGDVNVTAASTAATATFSAGDTIYFKGGVKYRGDIIWNYSGSEGSPIAFKGDGWGTGKAIIDGSVPVAAGSWTKATTQEEVPGNANYAHVYYTTIGTLPTTLTAQSGMSINVFQDETPIPPAQYPLSTNIYYQDMDLYLTPESSTTATIVDADLVGLGGAALIGSYVYLYNTANNEIYLKKITDYSASQITFATTATTAKYAIANVLGDPVFHHEGYCYLDEAALKLYVWPIGDADLSVGAATITYSTNRFGLYLNFKKYITVDGFKIQRQTGDDTYDGTYGKEGTAISRGSYCEVKNCEITGQYVWQDTATVFFESVSNVVFQSNYLHDTLGRGRGIQFGFRDNYTITNNIFSRIARTVIFSQTATNVNISWNTITDCNGQHGNGISPYLHSDGVLISYNRIINANIGITISHAGNVRVVGNLIDRQNNNDDNGNYCFASWGHCFGTNYVLNNTFVRSPIHYAFDWDATTDESDPKYIVQNNIFDGGMVINYGAGTLTNSHNIFTWLSWQQASLGYTYGTGESLVTNLSSIFRSATDSNFGLCDKSVAGDTGINLTGYGYTYDLDGKGRSGLWDIGAYDYQKRPNLMKVGLKRRY